MTFPALPALSGEAATRFPVDRHVRLGRCGSTNDVARERLLDGAPDGTVVLADAQAAGRGRRDRAWFSPPGRNVYLSLALRPRLAPARVPLLTLVLAVAGCEAVRAAGVQAAIKWPNDLVVRTDPAAPARKLGGILCEAHPSPGGGLAVVAGLGIDVNVEPAEWPDELRPIATSIRAERGREADRARVAGDVLEAFAPRYAALQRGGAGAILPDYRARLETVGRAVTVDLGQRVVEGTAEGLGPAGELRLRDAAGQLVTVTAGDVGL